MGKTISDNGYRKTIKSMTVSCIIQIDEVNNYE